MKRFRDMPYLVSESGEIWSEVNQKFLKICYRNRYANIQLGLKFRAGVHRIVAEIYVPNPNNYPCVNHIDGNRFNNHYTNLEWCTNKQNTRHAYDNNLINTSKGVDNHFSKMTEEQVLEIRRLYKEDKKKYNQTELGRRFGLTGSTVHSIVHRNTWKHLINAEEK